MGRTDVTGRPLSLRELDLDRFFSPRAIAVIGASDKQGSVSALNYRMVRDWQRQPGSAGAKVYPVNPNRDTVDGEKCFPSLADVPDEVDVAIVLVGDARAAVEAALEKRVPFVVVFTAGFAETGAEGERRQAEIVELVRDTGTHVLGPNTPLNAFQAFRQDLPGKAIALITQSGHQGRPLYQAQEIGVRLSHWAPTGNESDLESADFIRYLANNDEVGAIAMYVEGFRDGRTFMLAADEAARRGVPIVIVKVGRSEVGRSWAKSHSGHLAGSDAVTSAAFRQLGVTRVDGLDELLDVAQMFARAKPPHGDGVAIYSISGGTGAHIADLAAATGLRLAQFAPETETQLREWIPGYLRISNPVDSGGHPTGDWHGPKILDAILADPNVDVLIVPIAGSFSPLSDKLAQDLVDAAARTDKPVCVIWGSPPATEPGYREVLVSSTLPLFRSSPNCLTAVKAYLDYHAFRARHRSPFDKPVTRPLAAARDARTLLSAGRALSERESKQLLRVYGIPVTHDILATDAKEAARAAERIGLPVVLKASAPSLTHKSDLGLVRVGLSSARDVRAAFDEMGAIARDAAPDFEGILVSEMVSGGVETVVGVSQDPLFGPVVMFGIGGIAVEVYRDVSFRVPPFDRAEARRMIGEIRALPLLQGARGRPKADLTAIVDVIMKVQRLAMDLSGDLAELDVNPLLALPKGCLALDALAVPR